MCCDCKSADNNEQSQQKVIIADFLHPHRRHCFWF